MGIKYELHRLFWFAKISGMFHLNKNFRVSIFWTLYCVLIMVLSNAAFLYSEIKRQMEKAEDINSVVFLFSAGAEAGLSVLNIACCISCYFKNGKWLELLKGFEYIDWRLGAVKLNRWNRVTNGNIGSTILLLVCAITATLSGRTIDIWIILFLWNTVTLHLTKMNSVLYLAELRLVKMTQVVLHDPSKAVLCLDVYRQIDESLSVLGDIFSYQIIIFFAITFATFTDTAFSLVMDVLNHTLQIDTIWGKIKITADLLQLVYTMIFIPYQSTCMTKKAREFNEAIYQLSVQDQFTGLFERKKARMHLLYQEDITMTAYGFFNMDYPLIQSMIAGAGTLIVILYQFNASGGPPPC